MTLPFRRFNTPENQIKLTKINEITYDCSSLSLLNSVIYQSLSSTFTSIKLVSLDILHDFFFFQWKRAIR